jgi:hypothetical protein
LGENDGGKYKTSIKSVMETKKNTFQVNEKKYEQDENKKI